jgi:hypothetical protein
MGRGRAKAKQTKVARELKYGGPQTDFDQLQAELTGQPAPVPVEKVTEEEARDPEPDPDPYAKYYEEGEGETAS